MRRAILPAVALLILSLLAACVRPGSGAADRVDQELRVGQTAPAFTLPSADDGPVSLSDFRGRSVLLYFSMGPG